jgi:hypothetical protein
MTAVSDSRVNQATRIPASMALCASASANCDFPVPDRPAMQRFPARVTHSRVARACWAGAGMEESVSRQDEGLPGRQPRRPCAGSVARPHRGRRSVRGMSAREIAVMVSDRVASSARQARRSHPAPGCMREAVRSHHGPFRIKIWNFPNGAWRLLVDRVSRRRVSRSGAAGRRQDRHWPCGRRLSFSAPMLGRLATPVGGEYPVTRRDLRIFID